MLVHSTKFNAYFESIWQDLEEKAAREKTRTYNQQKTFSFSQKPYITKDEFIAMLKPLSLKISKELIAQKSAVKAGTRSTVLMLDNVSMEKSARKKGCGAKKKTSSASKIIDRQVKELIHGRPTEEYHSTGLKLGVKDVCQSLMSSLMTSLNLKNSVMMVKVCDWNGYTNKPTANTFCDIIVTTLQGRHDDKECFKEIKSLIEALTDTYLKIRNRVYAGILRNIIHWMDEQGLKKEFLFAFKCWGPNLTVREFNRIADNFEMISRLLNESPKIGLHALRLSSMLGVSNIGLSLLGDVKKALFDKGVTNSSWKSLGKLNFFHMRNLLGTCLSLKSDDEQYRTSFDFIVNTLVWAAHTNTTTTNMNKWCNVADHLSGMCVSPKITEMYKSTVDVYRTMKRLMYNGLPDMMVHNIHEAQAFINDSNAKESRMPSFFSATVERLLTTNDLENFNNEFTQVTDYLIRSELGTWSVLPEKITWNILHRRQVEWHEAILAQEKNTHNKHKWTSLIDKHEDDEWTAIALNDGGELWEEGKSMHHCVSSYAQTCKTSDCRIFSIRKNEVKYATLELRRDHHSKSWESRQFNGYCNARVTNPFALTFAKELVDKYNEAQKKTDAEATKKRSDSKEQLMPLAA